MQPFSLGTKKSDDLSDAPSHLPSAGTRAQELRLYVIGTLSDFPIICLFTQQQQNPQATMILCSIPYLEITGLCFLWYIYIDY